MNNELNTNNEIKTNTEKQGNIQTAEKVPTTQQITTTEVPKEQALSSGEQGENNLQKMVSNNQDVPNIIKTCIQGVDLMAYYDIIDKKGVPEMELSTFAIDAKKSKYVERYLTKVQGVQNTLYAPGTYADPFYDIEVDVGRGRVIGLNHNFYTKRKTNFRPGVVNAVPVAVKLQSWNDQVLPMPIKEINGETPLTNAEVLEMCSGYRAKTFGHNFEAYPWVNMTLYYGGDSFSDYNETFVIRGSLEEGVTETESYITANGAEFQNLNTANDSVKNLFYNMKLGNLRFNNQHTRRALEWIYNNGKRDPLAYNCFAQQLKLVLYMDQVSTGYDHIENWNSNNSWQFMVDKSLNVDIHRNINSNRPAGKVAQNNGGEFSWCTMEQYIRYMAGEFNISAWLTKTPYFVPVLKEWLEEGNPSLGALILSLYPYPIFTSLYRAQSVTYNNANVTTRGAAFEPLSSRIDIDGHDAICFVVLDCDDQTDPAQADYDLDKYSMHANGNTYRLANLEFGPPLDANQNYWDDDYNGEGNLFLWDWVVAWYNVDTNQGDEVITLFQKVSKWDISLDVMNFAAMLTTMPVSCFERGGNDPTVSFPNLQLTNLLAFDAVDGNLYHWNMTEPTFCQRVMPLLGLVRQRAVTSVFFNDYQRFRRMMYGTRMALGSCCAQLLATAKNEMSVIYPASDLPLSNYYLKRRQEFAILFESTFIKSNATLRPGKWQDPTKGIFAWVVPLRVVQGTYSRDFNADDPIREYCNVEDWVDLMETNLTAERFRYVNVPESVKEFGSVQNKNGHYWFVTNEVGRKPTDQVMQSFTDMYGRTVFHGMDILKYACRSGPNADVIQGDVWFPIYITSHFTWDASILNNSLIFTYVTAWGNKPFIRALDYTVPVVNDRESIPYKFAIPTARVNDWYVYVCIEQWDTEYVNTVKDLTYVPSFPALNPLN